jgi:hypothetical protein
MKRIGSLVRGSNSGLGNMAWEFARHGLIHKTLIVKRRMEVVFPDRFVDVRECWQDQINENDINWLLEDIDTLLIFENEYLQGVTHKAHKRGIRVVVMPMHEGTPHKEMYADLWLCPSSLEYNCDYGYGEKVRLNVPVNTDVIIWKERNKAKHFVHNTGRGGANLRNGTVELLVALDKTDTPFDLTIRSQMLPFSKEDKRLKIEFQNFRNYWDMWIDGDVFIFPEKFNGLSLPVQEAVAAGYAVMTGKRNPFKEWLPKELLIPIEGEYDMTMVNTFKAADISPDKIAKHLEKWYNKDITKFSKWGKEWGEQNSWKVLKQKYEEVL